MRFDEVLYNDALLDALDSMHFSECTPIQELAIPIVEQGDDLISLAQTGTGKTAAYLLPVLDCLADGGYPENAVNCVIMAPTRELVVQIDQQMQGFSYFLPGISSVAIYGGTDGKVFETQKQGLVKGASVVIATPGRLLAHLSMGYVDLSQVSFFVLDEADRMLDMGFFDDIMKVVSYLPKERQTMMFSATMPPKIKNLAERILTNPKEVKTAVSKPPETIEQRAYVCYERQKEGLLLHLFEETPPDRVIVFSSSKLKCKQLARALRQRRFAVGEMHSDLDQATREQVMLDFKAGRTKLIVATDILSRGIDIDDITMVVNFDVPHDAEDYVHRVGRTARAARTGRAVTFIGEREQPKFRSIEELIEREVEKVPLPADFGSTPRYTGGGADRRHGASAGRNGAGRGRGRKDRSGRRDKRKDGRQPDGKAPAQEPRPQQAPAQPSARGQQSAPQQEGQPQAAKKRRKKHRRKPGGSSAQAPSPAPAKD